MQQGLPEVQVTTGDSQADGVVENAVDGVFEQVDHQFDDLEREYNQARGEIASGDPVQGDPLEASNARFELLSQVASLQAELSRKRDELDERDRMLGELGDKIAGFETDIAQRDANIAELQQARQSVLDERREQARLSALLDARAAEREELAAVAQRFQNERDHVQNLLETAIVRYDEIEVVRLQLDDQVRHLEAARDTASHEHDARAHELVESRAEMSRLADRLEELTRATSEANDRAEKNDALAERRANESGYLNRRIEALNEKLAEAQEGAARVEAVRKELAATESRVHELERDLATERSESAAARAAVDALADRTSDYDELTARVARLTSERDAAWETASGHGGGGLAEVIGVVPETAVAGAAVAHQAEAVVGDGEVEASLADAARDLVERARELSGRRANEAEEAADEAEARAHTEALIRAEEQALAEATARLEQAEPVLDQEPSWVEPEVEPPVAPEPELVATTSEIPLITMPGQVEVPQIDVPQIDVPQIDVPQIDATSFDAEVNQAAAVDRAELPPPPGGSSELLPPPPEPEPAPEPEVVDLTAIAPLEVPIEVSPEPSVAEPDTSQVPELGGTRQRAILPAELVPNTPEAVTFLLGQPGVVAIVDARSTCGRTGIRPSDLFNRVAQLRDRFDVPVEVVVTPVSTPVGGAPDLPAIGVHQVTGADTVADRIRALCMAFPADQPLVVVAGDDHVRRAAIGEDANVLEPVAVMGMTGR